MIKAPSRIILIIAAIFAIGAMVVLNQLGQKITPKSGEEAEQEEAQAAQKTQQDTANKQAKPAPVSSAGAGSTDDLVMLGEDKTLGATNSAAPEVTVRWSWTPSVQNDPTKVYAGIKSLTTAFPQARIHVVNTDGTPEQPDGVFVGDKMLSPAGADGSINANPLAVKQALGK